MNRTAIIDIDNTLWPFSDAFYLELKKVNADFPTPDRWTGPGLWDGYCTKEDFSAAIAAIHRRQDSDLHLPYPEAQGFLTSLREKGFRVIIASHRSPATREPTERWLGRHELSYDDLHLSLDKTVLFPEADVVVDDAPSLLQKAVACGALGTGLRFPWNRAYEGNGFALFDNLDDVLGYILKALP